MSNVFVRKKLLVEGLLATCSRPGLDSQQIKLPAVLKLPLATIIIIIAVIYSLLLHDFDAVILLECFILCKIPRVLLKYLCRSQKYNLGERLPASESFK